MNANSYLSPRTTQVTAIIKAYDKRCREIKNTQGIKDRGLDKIKFILAPEFTKTCDILLLKGTLEAMRTRMDLLISKFMMLRSEDRRRAELPDLFYIPMKNEGVVGDANMLCLQLGQGKVCLYIPFRIN